VPSPPGAALENKGRFQTLLWAAIWTIPVLTGLAAIQLGKSAGFDFLVYHYYNGYAALTDRLNFDVLPAGRQTFFNPVADVFLFELVQNLPARLTAFFLGAIHGLNFVLAAAIATRVLHFARNLFLSSLPALLAGTGFLGAVNFGLIGSFHHDNLVSLFFLAALLIYCGPVQRPSISECQRLVWQALAGLSVGAGLGLKLSLAPFAVAILAAPLFLRVRYYRRVLGVASCGAGAVVGLMLTGGYYMVRMYQEFGDPLFPFLARYAKPPYDQFIGGQDLRYQPNGWLEYLVYPFVFAFNHARVSEFAYRDFRIPVTFAIALIFLVVLAWRYISRLLGITASTLPVWRISSPPSLFLGVIAIGYIAWLCSASVYRYALPIELLSFIVVAILLFDILGRNWGLVTLGLLAALIIPSTERFGIGRRAWGHEPYVVTQLPDRPRVQRDDLVLIVGANAGTYYIPAFPPSVRFLGIDVVDRWPAHAGEFRGPPAPEAMLEPFSHTMHAIIDNHPGQILLVFLANDRDRVGPALRSYHLHLPVRPCGLIRSNIAAVPPLWLCELERQASSEKRTTSYPRRH
jgi:hypothetical protein